MFEVSVVSAQCSCEFPDTLYRVEFWTVGRQEIKSDEGFVFLQPRCQKSGMMVAGVIEHDHRDHTLALMSEYLLQERQKRSGVKRIRQGSYQVPVVVSDCSQDSDTFSCRGMKHYRVNIFRRYPHHAS